MAAKHTIEAFCAAALTVSALSTPAVAAVQFDPATGKGSVDKADVMKALGWTNRQFDEKAGTLELYYDATDTVESVCVFDDGSPSKPIGGGTIPRHVKVLSSVGSPAGDGGRRAKPKDAGLVLNGFEEPIAHPRGVVCDIAAGNASEMKTTVTSTANGKLTVNGVALIP